MPQPISTATRAEAEPQHFNMFGVKDFYDVEPSSFSGRYVITKTARGPLKPNPLPRCYSDSVIIPCRYDKSLTHKVIEGMRLHRQEEIAAYPSINATALAQNINGEVWFTPMLVLLFALYSIAMAANKKSLVNEIKYIFMPNMLSSSYENETDNGLRNYFLLFGLSIISFAIFVFLVVQYLHGRIYASPLQSLATFLGVIAAFCLIKLFVLRLVCYVFYDYTTQNKVTRLFLLVHSILGLGVTPSMLMLAYSPAEYQTFALAIGLTIYALLNLAYLQKLMSFFFDGALSIFYLILYLCTVEILPLAGLYLVLTSIY